MTSNKEQQEEELLILKSILGEAIIELGGENDQFEVDIDFQLKTPFYLRLIHKSNQLSTLIQHLPPLVLTIHFHDEYPSSTYSPTFVLSSCYLSREYLQNMCRSLDRLWDENMSQPIVYQWIECLREQFSSVSELCLSHKIQEDSEENEDDDDDPRAMSSYDSSQAARVYEQLIEYNQIAENERFRQDYHECPVCMTSNIAGRDMIRLFKCHHAFCSMCLHDYAQIQINTGSVEWIMCPDSQCQLALLPSEIKVALNNDQLYDKYERLLLQKSLEQMQDIVWCPRCQQPVVIDSEHDNLGLCNECRYAFCRKCRKNYHPGTFCGRELELAELRAKHRRIREKMKAIHMSPADEERLLREALAVARVESSTRLCPNPNCQVPIEKNMGCDHMFCTRCRTHFNWSSVADQTTEEAKLLIEKFESDFEKVRKQLEHERTSQEPIDSTNAPEEPIISKLLAQRTKICPNIKCQKYNIKSGRSNYLVCVHCKRSFCFSCGNSIINPKTHFGHACKRHSDF